VDHTVILALATGLFGTLGGFIIAVWGKPLERFKHRQTIEKIESAADVKIAEAAAEAKIAESASHTQIAETEARVSSSAVTALAQRCEAMESNLATVHSLLAQQVVRTDSLQEINAKQAERLQGLQERVSQLEQQLREAGLVHTADLVTIADLRHELDSAVAAIAERDARIAALEARVAELEEALKAGGQQPKPAAKKKGRTP
jgi:chromosome segregation ATPase